MTTLPSRSLRCALSYNFDQGRSIRDRPAYLTRTTPVLTTLQLNLLAKIGLLWYEINDFSSAKKPTVLRTAPRPKLIGAGCHVLAKTKPAVFYCQMRQAELENSLFSQVNSLFDQTHSLFRCRTGKSWQRTGITAQIEVTKMVKNFANSLYFPVLREFADQAAPGPPHPAPISRTASSRSNR